MMWRYIAVFLVVVWVVLGALTSDLAVSNLGENELAMRMKPREAKVYLDQLKQSISTRDLILAQKQVRFIEERRAILEFYNGDESTLQELVTLLDQDLRIYNQVVGNQHRLNELVSSYPESRDILYERARINWSLLNDDIAQSDIERAVDLDPLFVRGVEVKAQIADRD